MNQLVQLQTLIQREQVFNQLKRFYTNPQAYELVLSGIDNTFSLDKAVGSLSSDEILQPEVAGDIGTITGTGGGGVITHQTLQ